MGLIWGLFRPTDKYAGEILRNSAGRPLSPSLSARPLLGPRRRRHRVYMGRYRVYMGRYRVYMEQHRVAVVKKGDEWWW